MMSDKIRENVVYICHDMIRHRKQPFLRFVAVLHAPSHHKKGSPKASDQNQLRSLKLETILECFADSFADNIVSMSVRVEGDGI